MFRHRVAGKVAAVVLTVAAAESARRGWAAASREGQTRESITLASRRDPSHAGYHVDLGRIVDTDAGDPRPHYRAALDRSPRDASTWIRLGLAEEQHGRLREAEAALLAASRVSRLHEPAWTLANFYYRRRDAARFSHWARRTLAVTYRYEAVLFDQAWDLLAGPRAVESLLPDNEPVRLTYGHYLAGRQRWDELEAFASISRADAGIVNALAAAYRVRAAAAQGITSGTLLDWRAVAPTVHRDPGGWRVESGARGVLLERIAPLLRGRRYVLTAGSTGDPAGLEWRVTAQAPGEAPVASGPADRPLPFTAPAAEGVRVTLVRVAEGGACSLAGPRLEEVP